MFRGPENLNLNPLKAKPEVGGENPDIERQKEKARKAEIMRAEGIKARASLQREMEKTFEGDKEENPEREKELKVA